MRVRYGVLLLVVGLVVGSLGGYAWERRQLGRCQEALEKVAGYAEQTDLLLLVVEPGDCFPDGWPPRDDDG